MAESIKNFFIRLFIGEVKGGEPIDLTYGKKRIMKTLSTGQEMNFNEKAAHIHREIYKMKGLQPKL